MKLAEIAPEAAVIEAYALRLTGIRFPAHIGVSHSERVTEQELVVDVDLTLPVGALPTRDRVSEVVDYDRVARFVVEEGTSTSHRLLETYVARVVRRLLSETPALRVRVAATKRRAPTTHPVDAAVVEMVGSRSCRPPLSKEPMTLLSRIDERIAAQHLLTHPFYLAWSAGTLPRTSLLDYARQYHAFESRLPRFLTALHARSEDADVRAALLSNAWDEENGGHAELWLRFAEALGVARIDVVDAPPHVATRALVETYVKAATEAPVVAGVAALYAYESQLAAVSQSKIDGLARHYDVTGDGVTFFEVHRAIDVEHAAAERRILESATDEAVVTWTERALDAWWTFLNAFPTTAPE